MTDTTDTTKEPVRHPERHAAALNQAIALRMLHWYQTARSRADFYGADLSKLIEAPGAQNIHEDYEDLVDEWAPESISNVTHAGAACDLLGVIAVDELLVDALNESGPHQPRIPRNIGGEDRGKAAGLAHPPSPAARRRPDR